MFYNTTAETGPTLTAYRAQAKTQCEAVLTFFRLNPGASFTPFEVWDKMIEWQMIDARTPLTSIRRAITDLTPDHLVKLDLSRLERLGRGNHVWRLKAMYEQTKLF